VQPKTFVIVSTTDWDAPQFGSRQQIAQCLARRGHRVLYVEVPRALHSLISDPEGTHRAMRRMGRTRSASSGLQVFTPPPVLPVYYQPATNAVNQRLLRRYVQGALNRLRWQAEVLWTYWPNTAYLIGKLGERMAVYHCIDDFAAAGYPLTTRRAIAAMEAEQCRKVQLIFARTPSLADARSVLNPRTHLLPGGVDTDLFDLERVKEVPASMQALPRPRVGFIGTIDDRIDVGMLVQCARGLPAVSFVLLGPIKRHRVQVSALRREPNVHLLPACPHDSVPAAVAALDICLIPYRINTYTQALSPVKLYEYLAMGRPVVATDLPYLQREAELVRIARSGEEFLREVQQALQCPLAPANVRAMRQAAEMHSWRSQVDAIERYLEPLLEESKARHT
jgi:glycosyltransferase involved in cell wall biosynthesis